MDQVTASTSWIDQITNIMQQHKLITDGPINQEEEKAEVQEEDKEEEEEEKAEDKTEEEENASDQIEEEAHTEMVRILETLKSTGSPFSHSPTSQQITGFVPDALKQPLYNPQNFPQFTKVLHSFVAESEKNRDLHYIAAEYFTSEHKRLKYPSMLCTGLGSIGALIAGADFVPSPDWIMLGVGIMVGIGHILQSYIDANAYQTRAEAHQLAAEGFAELTTTMAFESTFPNNPQIVPDLEKKIRNINLKCKHNIPLVVKDMYRKRNLRLLETRLHRQLRHKRVEELSTIVLNWDIEQGSEHAKTFVNTVAGFSLAEAELTAQQKCENKTICCKRFVS